MEAAPITIAVAFSAGLLSFLSPCVLPLIPSYASFITGMSLADLSATEAVTPGRQRTALIHGLLFVSGFTFIFMMLGAGATMLGSLFAYYGLWIERVGGALLILFGLLLLGVLRLPGAERDFRVHLANKPVGYFGTVVVGLAFGAGWTPCLGPVLGGILTLAALGETVRQGMGLLFMYSLGLAVPFLLATVALQRFMTGYQRFRAWLPWVNRISGALLVVIGILLITGSFSVLAAYLMRLTPQFLLDLT